MSEYSNQLKLKFDPFDSSAEPGEYFPGGDRQTLLDQLLHLSCYSSDMAIVTGPLGSGKSSLSHTLAQRLDDDFIVVCLQASLFMGKPELLEAIARGLDLDQDGLATVEDFRSAIVNFANFMADKSKTVEIIVDDAHELSGDAMTELANLVESQADTAVLGEGGIKVVLLGESQLPETLALVTSNPISRFELNPLTRADTVDYVAFKLETAGYTGTLPLGEVVLAMIHEQAGGTPGAINNLVRDELGDLDTIPTRFSLPYSPLAFAERHLVPVSVVFSLFIIGLFVIFTGDEEVPETLVADVEQGRIDIPIEVTPANRREDPIEIEPVTEILSSSAAEEITAAQTVVTTEPTAPDEVAEEGQTAVTELATVNEPAVEEPMEAEAEPATEIVSEELSKDLSDTPTENQEVATQVIEQWIEPIPAAPVHPLLTYPADSYTLQILGSRSEANVLNFIDQNSDRDSFNYFETRFENQPWYVVVYGSFPDPLAAKAAIPDLPPSISELNPWARHLSDIQQDIRTYSQ